MGYIKSEEVGIWWIEKRREHQIEQKEAEEKTMSLLCNSNLQDSWLFCCWYLKGSLWFCRGRIWSKDQSLEVDGVHQFWRSWDWMDWEERKTSNKTKKSQREAHEPFWVDDVSKDGWAHEDTQRRLCKLKECFESITERLDAMGAPHVDDTWSLVIL